MRLRIAALLASGLLALAPSWAQDVDDAYPDGTLTREQWQARVEAARRRSEDFIANARTQMPSPLPSDRLQTEAADRAVNDPTLRQGDIVSTPRGLFVFIGRDEEHQSSDFKPVPNRRTPPEAVRTDERERTKKIR